MGALMRRLVVDGVEVHESTGKLAPLGVRHDAQQGAWSRDDGYWLRQCQHPGCHLDDYSMTDRPPA